MSRPLDDLARRFRFFAGVCAEQSPLYAMLSMRVADDPDVMRLALSATPKQPPENLLFGAVHDLLLSGHPHPLAAYYPSVGGREPPTAATYDAFAALCLEQAEAITEIVATRRVQTNEVGRGALLLPAIALAWECFERRPLHLVELGCSAGLNLRLDRYRHEWTRDGTRHACGPEGPVTLRVELRGADAILPTTMPEIAGRVGIDVAPADVTDADAMRWLEALIWPDGVGRHEQFRAAVALAIQDPPRVITGEGLETVPGLVAGIPVGGVPCIYHSHATYQMSGAWRTEFESMIDELGTTRDLAHVSLEWLGDAPGPQLHLATFRAGVPERRHLADAHHHGLWLRWHS